MKRLVLVSLSLLALASAAPAAAQNKCDLIRQEGTWSSIGDPANRVISAQGPLVVTCSNGEVLRADSAVIYQTTNEVQLYRRVDYQDPGKSLTLVAALLSLAGLVASLVIRRRRVFVRVGPGAEPGRTVVSVGGLAKDDGDVVAEADMAAMVRDR